MKTAIFLFTLLALGAMSAEAAELSPQLSTERQKQLVRMVRQDCGACHGLRLTGGLGPAITREALTGLTPEVVVIFIMHGRQGTPMPGWNAMLSEADAYWIAERLLAGFPEEP